MLQYAIDQPYPPNNGNIRQPPSPQQVESWKFRSARLRFAFEEGAALLISPSPEGDGGTIYVQAAELPRPINGNSIRPFSKEAKTVPQIVVSVEQYNRMRCCEGFPQQVWHQTSVLSRSPFTVLLKTLSMKSSVMSLFGTGRAASKWSCGSSI